MLSLQPDTFLRVTENLAFFIDRAVRNGMYSVKFSIASWRKMVIMCTTCWTFTYSTFWPHSGWVCLLWFSQWMVC